MTKKDRLKEIEKKYQDRLNHMIVNDLIDGYAIVAVVAELMFLLFVAIDNLKAADGRCRNYQEYERLTLENLEKAFNDVEKEELK
jgi:hypothetical protein